MPDKKREHKLDVRQQMKVLALIAGGYNAQRIVDYLIEHEGVTVNRHNVQNNYITNKKYKERINSIRNIIDKNLAAHPLHSKTNRLNILLEAINESFTWRHHRSYYDKDGNFLEKIEKRNIGVIPNLINEARREVEGDKGTVEHIAWEEVFVKLLKDSDAKLEGIDGFRITRKTYTALDRALP